MIDLDKDCCVYPVYMEDNPKISDWKLIVNISAFKNIDEALEYVKELGNIVRKK